MKTAVFFVALTAFVALFAAKTTLAAPAVDREAIFVAQITRQTVPQACPVQVVVPVNRSNPSVGISVDVTATLYLRTVLQGQPLATPRKQDLGDRIIFNFDRPASSCSEMIRIVPTVTCSAQTGIAGVSQTDSYVFPSTRGFANLSEVTIPKVC